VSVSEATRHCIVEVRIDEKTVALGTVIDTNGSVLTKASELKPGRLGCRLASGQDIAAAVVAVDETNDVALLNASAAYLEPIQWATKEAVVGEWVVTPGIGTRPEAIGIVSAPMRRILHKRAFIGVALTNTPAGKIIEIVPGLGAEKAGLKIGDVIVALNDVPIKATEELIRTLRYFREGQKVKLRVQREGEEFEVNIEMGLPQPVRRWGGPSRQELLTRLAGEVSHRAEDFEQAMQHDSVLQPWQCGGPLVNLEGKAVGVNIARAGRTASYALPATLLRHIIAELRTRASQSNDDEEEP
jgi:serine protease Do